MLKNGHTTMGFIATAVVIGNAVNIMRMCYFHQMTMNVNDDTAISQTLKTTN